MHQVRPQGPLSRPKADRGIRPQGQYVEMVVRPEGRLPATRCTQSGRSLRLGVPWSAEGLI